MKKLSRLDVLHFVQGSLNDCQTPQDEASYWLLSAVISLYLEMDPNKDIQAALAALERQKNTKAA